MSPRTCIPVPKIEDDCYDWFQRHTVKVEAAASQKYDAIFIGDSITHFWADEDGYPIGANVWHSLYDNRSVLNLGFGFDRTQNVLWRLEQGEIQGQKPKFFVVNIGTNQFSVTPKYSGDSAEDTAAGIIAVLKKLRESSPDSRIVLMGLFPRGEGAFFSDRISAVNRIMKQFVSGQSNMDFLDLTSVFSGTDGNVNAQYYIADRTHLSPLGYEVWGKALEPFFEQN